jgi:hypothetical protein
MAKVNFFNASSNMYMMYYIRIWILYITFVCVCVYIYTHIYTCYLYVSIIYTYRIIYICVCTILAILPTPSTCNPALQRRAHTRFLGCLKPPTFRICRLSWHLNCLTVCGDVFIETLRRSETTLNQNMSRSPTCQRVPEVRIGLRRPKSSRTGGYW